MPNFTDLFIKKAPEGIHWDDKLAGFGLRVGKKRRAFLVLVESGRRKSIGSYPLMSLADARAEAKTILAEKTLGKVRPRHTAYEDAKTQYLAECTKKNRPVTVSDYTRILSKHYPFKRKNVGDITAHDIIKRLDKLNHSPAQKRYAFAVGRAFFKYCVQQHIIPTSPFVNLAPPPTPKSRDRVLARDELAQIWGTVSELIASKTASSFHFIVALLLLTGQRKNEITCLEWDWISDTEINLPATITKNKRPNSIPRTAQIDTVLAAIPVFEDSPWLFPATKRVSDKTTVFNGFSKAKRNFDTACGVSDWKLHDLRRSVSSYMAELGVPQIHVEKLLNHVSGGEQSQIAQVYNRYDYQKEKREALVKWHQFLDTLILPRS